MVRLDQSRGFCNASPYKLEKRVQGVADVVSESVSSIPLQIEG